MPAGILRWCRHRDSRGGYDVGTGEDSDGAIVHELESQTCPVKERRERCGWRKASIRARRLAAAHDVGHVEQLQPGLLGEGLQRLIQSLRCNINRERGARRWACQRCRHHAQPRTDAENAVQGGPGFRS